MVLWAGHSRAFQGAGVSLPGLEKGLRKEGHRRRCFAGALGLWVLEETAEA